MNLNHFITEDAFLGIEKLLKTLAKLDEIERDTHQSLLDLISESQLAISRLETFLDVTDSCA